VPTAKRPCGRQCCHRLSPEGPFQCNPLIGGDIGCNSHSRAREVRGSDTAEVSPRPQAEAAPPHFVLMLMARDSSTARSFPPSRNAARGRWEFHPPLTGAPFSQATKFTTLLEFFGVVDTSMNNSNNLRALRKSSLRNDLHQPFRHASKDRRSLSGAQAPVLPPNRWSFPSQHDGTVVAGEV
jgi:hypothetical protein